MILPESLLTKFHEKLGFYSCTVPIFEQYVLAELIKNGDFERHINRVRREKRQKAARGKNKFLLTKQLIEMRQDQYVLKSAYKPPITATKLIKNSNKINLNEKITVNERG